MGGTRLETGVPINAISAGLARVETVLIVVSGVAMLMIVGIVVADVVMRYVFSSPFTWSYNLIGLYLVGAVFFLALPDTLQHHGHVALDVFAPLLPDRIRHLIQALGYAASCGLILLIAWFGWAQAESAFSAGERIAAAVPFPTWVSDALLAIGMSILCLRCLYRATFHCASALLGRDVVELPPPPESGETAEGYGE